MIVFVLKGLGGDLFTFFHGVSALIIDLVSWHSSSCSMDLFMMRELCFPCDCYSFDLFCSRPGKVSDKSTRRNIFTIISLCLFHKGSVAER
jgi:hypothetical protein